MLKSKSERGVHRSWWHGIDTDVMDVPVILFHSLMVAVVALTILLWSAQRGRKTHLRVEKPGEFRVLLPSIVGLTGGSIEQGNSVTLLENGDGYFPALLEAFNGAKESINLESYIWWKGPICDQIAAALSAKARAGVEVRVLLDASGASRMDEKLEKMMKDAGCKLVRFHPIRLHNLARLNNRDHRKISVIDGRIGFIGGHGIAKEWTGNGQDRNHWRDTAVRLEGPIVNRLQGAFSENWIEETGEVFAGPKFFPPAQVRGNVAAHLAYTTPTGGVSAVQVLYYMAIKSARHEIIIQNPYMLPDQDAIRAMAEAVRRGVSVKVMVPATTVTDSPIVQHASHHSFADLLRAGVEIWEYKRTLLHQKIIIVDGIWSCVGSTNFDDRSLQLNDEATLGMIDAGLASQLKQQFEADKKYAEQRHLEEWTHRGLWHKFVDGVLFIGRNQL